MNTWRLLYWLGAGFLTGAGLIIFDIYLIARPLMLIGLAMLIAGIVRFRSHEFWAFLISLGGVPALGFIFVIVTAGPPCTGQSSIVPPGGPAVSCTDIPQSDHVFAAIFTAIALVGVGELLLSRNRIQR
jgi:hypothetical protein